MTAEELQFRTRIIESMRLTGDKLKFAKAMYLKPAMAYLKPEQINSDEMKARVEAIAQDFVAYTGDISSGKVDIIQKLFLKELVNHYGHMTFMELEMAIPKALRGFFGAHTKANTSFSFLSECIAIYERSDFRQEIQRAYLQARASYNPVERLSKADKEKLSRDYCVMAFSKYKENPDHNGIYCNVATYDGLLVLCSMPDWDGFKEQAMKVLAARQMAKKKDEGVRSSAVLQSAIMEVIKPNSVVNIAKALAVRSLFDQLIAQDRTIEEFIKQGKD